jgi:hypothetical protein
MSDRAQRDSRGELSDILKAGFYSLQGDQPIRSLGPEAKAQS